MASSLVEQRFIAETLQENSAYIFDAQSAAIARSVGSRSTGHLLRSRFFRIDGTTLRYEHPAYERFLDMKSLRRNGRAVRRKPKRIHNRFMWGLYSRIKGDLMSGLTDDVVARIRETLAAEQ